ncbi:MAG: energy transducer TonB [Gammaproteobacteria bacterium]|nr:energy transducer TonB [Gammaproteobacteria bacterium]
MRPKPVALNPWPLRLMLKHNNTVEQSPLLWVLTSLVGGVLLAFFLLFSIDLLAHSRSEPVELKPVLVLNLLQPIVQKSAPQQPVVKKTVPKPKKKRVQKPKLIKNKILKKAAPKKIQPKTIVSTPIEQVVEEPPKPEVTQPVKPVVTAQAKEVLPTPEPIFKLSELPQFLHREAPIYPETMRAAGRSGVVKLEALIDKTGKVRRVSIITSEGEAFDQAAKRAIMASSFSPAKIADRAVAVRLRLPVRFSLR